MSLLPQAKTTIGSNTSQFFDIAPPCLVEHLDVAPGLVARVAALAGRAGGARAHARERGVVRAGRARDRGDAALLVAGLEQERVLAVGQQVAHSTGARGDERLPQRGRLDEDVREAVVVRRDNDEVAGEVEGDEMEAIDRRKLRGL